MALANWLSRTSITFLYEAWLHCIPAVTEHPAHSARVEGCPSVRLSPQASALTARRGVSLHVDYSCSFGGLGVKADDSLVDNRLAAIHVLRCTLIGMECGGMRDFVKGGWGSGRWTDRQVQKMWRRRRRAGGLRNPSLRSSMLQARAAAQPLCWHAGGIHFSPKRLAIRGSYL